MTDMLKENKNICTYSIISSMQKSKKRHVLEETMPKI